MWIQANESAMASMIKSYRKRIEDHKDAARFCRENGQIETMEHHINRMIELRNAYYDLKWVGLNYDRN